LYTNNEQRVTQPPSGNQATCVALVEEERKVWRYLVEAGNALLELMSMSQKDAKKAINKNKEKYRDYNKYIEGAIIYNLM
jgi:hypothetical protein